MRGRTHGMAPSVVSRDPPGRGQPESALSAIVPDAIRAGQIREKLSGPSGVKPHEERHGPPCYGTCRGRVVSALSLECRCGQRGVDASTRRKVTGRPRVVTPVISFPLTVRLVNEESRSSLYWKTSPETEPSIGPLLPKA